MTNKSLYFFLVAVALGVISCNSNYSSKKTGYSKIVLPAHQYSLFDKPDYPYSFEYPAYSNIVKDSSFFTGKPENDYWINVDFPSLNAKIFLSYKIIGGTSTYKIKQASGNYKDSIGNNRFDLMGNEAFNLTRINSRSGC